MIPKITTAPFLSRPLAQQNEQTRIVRMPLPSYASASDGFSAPASRPPVELGDPASPGRQFLRQLENALRFGYLSKAQGAELAHALVTEGMTESLSMRLEAQLAPVMTNPVARLVNLTERVASGSLSNQELASAQKEIRALQRTVAPPEMPQT